MSKKMLYLIVIVCVVVLALVLTFVMREKDMGEAAADRAPTSVSGTPAKVGKAGRWYSQFPGMLPHEEIANARAIVRTIKGDIRIAFLPDEAPLAVSNFVTLARDAFYDGLLFHRREEGFVIQGGDPNGNGTGGPGYAFPDEIPRRAYSRGVVAMANAGPNTNGSQFFIMLADVPLPPLYTIFGYVTEGMDVVDQIAIGDTMTTVTIE